MKNNKAMIPVMALVVLGIIAFIVYSDTVALPHFSTASLTGSGEYIERPVFKYVKCEAVDSLRKSEFSTVASDGWILPKPSVTNAYSVVLSVDRLDSFLGATTGYYTLFYSICQSQLNSKDNCRVNNQKLSEGNSISVSNIYTISELKPTEFVNVRLNKNYFFKDYTQTNYLKSQLSYIPYGLKEYDVLSGSPTPINKNDCEIPASADSWTDRILSTDSSKVSSQYSKVSKSVNERVLQPEEVRWYVSGYVSSAGPSFKLTYKSQEAWCRTTGTNAEIYKINKVVVGSGTYKIASPDFSDLLGTETCCPGQTRGTDVCQSDFTYKSIQGSECGAFKSCGSANWVPYSENQIIRYSCVSGTCKSETKEVECANGFDCKDSNQICDLNTFKCVEANVNLKGQVIKTIPDNKADCEKDGGSWIRNTENKKEGIFCFFGYGYCQEKVIVNEFCEYPKPLWKTILMWVIIAIVVILLIVFVRPLLKGIPKINKFIP